MTVRAKLKLTQVRTTAWRPGVESKTLRFDAQYDSSIPEDRRFEKATPSGHCEMQIDNPAALEQFELGKDYYIDFTPAD